jgi:hypothetical protein
MIEYNSVIIHVTSNLKLRQENITNEDMLEKISLHFMFRICFDSSNIENVILKNI